MEYVVLDEGWYDAKSGDMLTVIPELNLPELIRYGKSKGVELVLWTVFNVLDSQLDEACRKYAEWESKALRWISLTGMTRLRWNDLSYCGKGGRI